MNSEESKLENEPNQAKIALRILEAAIDCEEEDIFIDWMLEYISLVKRIQKCVTTDGIKKLISSDEKVKDLLEYAVEDVFEFSTNEQAKLQAEEFKKFLAKEN